MAQKQRWVLKISRVEALTDGIFAIAMTILVFNLSLPHHLDSSLLALDLQDDVMHKLFVYAGSFIILGTYWVGMDFQLGFLEHVNRLYLWINVFYLMFVCVVPFSASLLGNFPHHEITISFYAMNLICISLLQLVSWWYAQTFRLNAYEAVSGVPAVSRSIYRRIWVAPIFYVASVIIAHWSIDAAFVALVAPPLIHVFPGAVDKYSKK